MEHIQLSIQVHNVDLYQNADYFVPYFFGLLFAMVSGLRPPPIILPREQYKIIRAHRTDRLGEYLSGFGRYKPDYKVTGAL